MGHKLNRRAAEKMDLGIVNLRRNWITRESAARRYFLLPPRGETTGRKRRADISNVNTALATGKTVRSVFARVDAFLETGTYIGRLIQKPLAKLHDATMNRCSTK